ncbi:MAG: glycoside hydrolase family 65 protein [Streptosporangiales bacterium]|nr:glycoside hydrolase family 65 protein [Streptosporangiales bacterium]
MNPWELSYTGYDPASERTREALCTLGNGYFATRGAAPESRAGSTHYPGTYIAGCYDRQVSSVAGGGSVENEDLVNVPNCLCLTFRIDGGDWFDLDRWVVLDTRQVLQLRGGVLRRMVRVDDGSGRVTRVEQRRLVSMHDRHLAALESMIIPENWSGTLEVRSSLDGRIVNSGVERYLALQRGHLEVAETFSGDDIAALRTRTLASRTEIVLAARTRVNGTRVNDATFHTDSGLVDHFLTMDATQGRALVVEKVAAVFTSRDPAVAEPLSAARDLARSASGFGILLNEHVEAWGRLWRRHRIEVDDTEVQRTLNLYTFHLLQTLSPHTTDLDVGVPARGLHGEAYRGHVFWDELFVLPLLSLRSPEISRALLIYRWRRLPQARIAAARCGKRGAMFPWQSGSDGREESQSFHLNPLSGRWLPDHSRLQRHVGLAIAYNVWQYYDATADDAFLIEYGAELLLDTARYFADLATYDETRERYEIHGVMGPDEYHDAYPGASEAGLRNNAYTNVMTAWLMRKALDVLSILPMWRRRELCEKLALSDAEIERFDHVSHRLVVPFHDGVVSQFAGYEDLAELDWDRYRERYGDIRRLDRILEAEGDSPNAYKASKQADALMLFYLLSAEEFSEILGRLGYTYDADLIPRTVDYYLARTTHGSSLSAVVHAWVLSRTDRESSWHHFLEVLHGELATVGGTTAEGIHLGAMAGALDLAQRCYGGLRLHENRVHLHPCLPRELGELSFGLRFHARWELRVRCDGEGIEVTGQQDSTAVPVVVDGAVPLDFRVQLT